MNLIRRASALFSLLLHFAFAELIDDKILRNPSKIRVGIIGAGIGGTATSWFLRQRFGDAIEIVILERAHIGGRVHSAELDAHLYEAGASIYHEKNQLIQHFVKVFGLTKEKSNDDGQVSQIYRDKTMVFETTGWKYLDMIKALFRYGLSPVKMTSWVDKKTDQFSNIYELFKKNCSFLRPADLVLTADPKAQNMLDHDLKSVLLADGFSQEYIDEIAGTAMRVNYNQGTKVPAYVGSVSLAGMEGPTLHIKGGNHQVISKLAESADKVVLTGVEVIEALNISKFVLTMDDHTSLVCDYVVLAAPFHHNSTPIEFKKFPEFVQPKKWTGGYQRTVTTLIEATLNSSYFGGTNSLDSAYFLDLDESIASISKIRDVAGKTPSGYPSWKIFSKKPVSTGKLDEIFSLIRMKKEIDWYAYPDYSQPPEQVPPFVLYGNLFYLNGIEWMASAMEMSLIAAQNIAIAIETIITGREPSCPDFTMRSFDEL